MPPPAPRDCFGRDNLVEKVVRLAENLEPTALIGAGGIGKTSIALTVLHHDRIKERFDKNRRFIRCDEFPASRAHFLARLSKVFGAGVESPEDLTSLRPFLSSKTTFIVLDNAESILDPSGINAKEIYSVVDELCQLDTISLLITSRITTVPPRCKCPEIPPLSKKAASDIFYGIYGGNSRRVRVVNDLLQRLDFHPLSITLLAATASHNRWDRYRLRKERDMQRAQVLRADYNESLTATIELSFASPTFRSLDPEARDLLGVVAFFPQGIRENDLDLLFPIIPNKRDIFDKFFVLSLTYRSNGFITMLAPIRDYLCPQDPRSSPLLRTTGDRYFRRLSLDPNPDDPGFEEGRWIKSEDIYVEHLLDVFTSIDPDSSITWDACYNFIEHLHQFKPRQTILGSKIEALADNHPLKSKCLTKLSELFGIIGNHAEQKRLLTCTLKVQRCQRDDFGAAITLRRLCDVNWLLGRYKRGVQQVKEALEIYEWAVDAEGPRLCMSQLARVLLADEQLDAAEDAARRAIDLTPEKGQEFDLCQLHRILGRIYISKGRKVEAIHHLETALQIASPPNWHNELFWIHYALAGLFLNDRNFHNSRTHIKLSESHTVDCPYSRGRVVHLQAELKYKEGRLHRSKASVLVALKIFEELGSKKDVGDCKNLLQEIERAINIKRVAEIRAASSLR